MRWKNTFLAFASIMFYAWGEPRFVILMLLSVAFNFYTALAMERARTEQSRKTKLTIAITTNLLLLATFKYLVFFCHNVLAVIAMTGLDLQLNLPEIALPIGISFYTFHAISYLIDIYRRNVQANQSLIEYSLYIMLFPQLVAGPIIRYKDIHTQLQSRQVTSQDLEAGIYRFVLGLSKKVLLANPLALIADTGFDSPVSELSNGGAWLCLVAYTLQIYFDFSGYSDMAIGLARMFGFRFPENFLYPYTALSLQDFWRRWHISLSTWFRDYVYIPLGGNKAGTAKTFLNLWIVFLLTGIWHGASWNFLIWGGIHGFFLMTERFLRHTSISRIHIPEIFCRFYAMLVVMLAWVFFRIDNLANAIDYIKVLFGLQATKVESQMYSAAQSLHIAVLLAIATIFAAGGYPRFIAWMTKGTRTPSWQGFAKSLTVLPLLIMSIMMLAVGQYNPFIYFRF